MARGSTFNTAGFAILNQIPSNPQNVNKKASKQSHAERSLHSCQLVSSFCKTNSRDCFSGVFRSSSTAGRSRESTEKSMIRKKRASEIAPQGLVPAQGGVSRIRL